MLVTKSSGKQVAFDHNRIIRTCKRAGLSKKEAEEVAQIVEGKIYDGIATKKLLKIVLSELEKYGEHVSMKYDLKGALMRLGPSGFAFEKFIARVLEQLDWKVKTNSIITGGCITHEIDVIAEKADRVMIECKYHNSPGIYTGVKDILYTYARFLDLQDGYKSGKCEKFDGVWLASNTKFSTDTMKYGSCRGIELLGWNYPKGGSLAELIEKTKTYPITMLRGLTPTTKNTLIEYNIVTVKDLLEKQPKIKNISLLLQQAEQLTKQ